jgi:predicted DNA binding protein
MSLFGAFLVPSRELLLHVTLNRFPDITIEIERVVATDEWVTPYFWMAGADAGTFEEAVTTDSSVDELKRLDSFEEGTLYRADWTGYNEAFVYAYTEIGTTILEATGRNGQWELRMRFDDRNQLAELQEYFNDNDVEFALTELHEVTHPRSPAQYGLTEKQEEALVAAWQMNYFETPRDVTLSEIADDFGITEQALSNRLRRGYDTLIANTLMVSSSAE